MNALWLRELESFLEQNGTTLYTVERKMGRNGSGSLYKAVQRARAGHANLISLRTIYDIARVMRVSPRSLVEDKPPKNQERAENV